MLTEVASLVYVSARFLAFNRVSRIVCLVHALENFLQMVRLLRQKIYCEE